MFRVGQRAGHPDGRLEHHDPDRRQVQTARNQKFRTQPHRKTIPSRIKTSPNTTKLTYAVCKTTMASASSLAQGIGGSLRSRLDRRPTHPDRHTIIVWMQLILPNPQIPAFPRAIPLSTECLSFAIS